MSTEPKTMFGWPMDKNLDDFLPIISGLRTDNESSRADAFLYLIERCKIAEAKIKAVEEVEMNIKYDDTPDHLKMKLSAILFPKVG